MSLNNIKWSDTSGCWRVELTQGQSVLVDNCDISTVQKYKWCAHKWKNGYYAITNIKESGKQKTLRMHRLLLNAPSGLQVDHANGNTLDNRRQNIRLCNSTENNQNKSVSIRNKSGFKGVDYFKRTGKWRARIVHLGRERSLGYFNTPEAAAKEYDKAAISIFGQFAKTNF